MPSNRSPRPTRTLALLTTERGQGVDEGGLSRLLGGNGGHDAGVAARELVVKGVDLQPLDLALARIFAAELLTLAPLLITLTTLDLAWKSSDSGVASSCACPALTDARGKSHVPTVPSVARLGQSCWNHLLTVLGRSSRVLNMVSNTREKFSLIMELYLTGSRVTRRYIGR